MPGLQASRASRSSAIPVASALQENNGMSFASHAAKSTAIHRDHRRPPLTLNIRNVRTHDALARFSGDEARYLLARRLHRHGPRTVRKIRAAVDTRRTGNRDAARAFIQGRTGMLGMIELHALALALETTPQRRAQRLLAGRSRTHGHGHLP